MKKWILAAVAAAVAAIAGPASAQDYSMDFTIGGLSGSASFHVTGNASAGFVPIDSLTGIFNGDVMTLLAPGTFPALQPNDNLFRDSAPFIDFNGLGFSAGGHSYNLYSDAGEYSGCSDTYYDEVGFCTQSASLSVNSAAVPEVGTWALMIAGFGCVGFAARRSRKNPGTALQIV